MKRILLIIFILAIIIIIVYKGITTLNWNTKHSVGDAIDSLNGVKVYYNGGVEHVDGRNLSADGYNLGLKYQCVEFVKRYYYEHLHHKMPDSYGHAKDFYDSSLKDGDFNKKRNLKQFANPSSSKPKVNDLLVYSGHIYNRFGHVAIIASVNDEEIEIIQQNPGAHSATRERFKLVKHNSLWKIENDRIMGWLRK